MKNWWIYLQERFPLPVYGLLVGGFATSSAYLGSGYAPLDWGRWFWGALAILWFFALLRLMDEFKDYDKDCIAHPERPLPRGLLPLDRVRTVIYSMSFGLLLLATLGRWYDVVAATCLFGLIVHLWLMFREFYCGAWLERHMWLYALTHQLVLVWVVALAFFLQTTDHRTESWTTMGLYATAVIGSFFSYEIGRKLDPDAAPILGYYRTLYGPVRCQVFLVALNLMAAWAAWHLGLGLWLWPAELIVVAVALVGTAKHHKLVELAATLSLAWHLWVPTLHAWIGA